MGQTKLTFLLMGKTGEGKSATGNMILGRRVFKTSSRLTSETKNVSFSIALFDNYLLLVVDGPGLEDTDLDKLQDKTAEIQNMEKALGMCYGGVDVFLLVIKFGNRFTEENRKAIDALHMIFGDGFTKHIIVVVTCGDLFQEAMIEEEHADKSFHEWCREQTDPDFNKLYKDSEGRFVLFNNRERDEGRKRAQILELVNFASNLQNRSGRYTSQCFREADREREKMILELKVPQLKEEFQRKMCLLSIEIENLHERSSIEAKEKVTACVHDLRAEIDRHDNDHGVLQELKHLITTIEENLDDKTKIIALGERLDEIKKCQAGWKYFGSAGTFVGGLIGGAGYPVGAAVASIGAAILGTAIKVVAPPVGAILVVGGAVISGVRLLKLDSEKTKIEQEKDRIRNKQKARSVSGDTRETEISPGKIGPAGPTGV